MVPDDVIKSTETNYFDFIFIFFKKKKCKKERKKKKKGKSQLVTVSKGPSFTGELSSFRLTVEQMQEKKQSRPFF